MEDGGGKEKEGGEGRRGLLLIIQICPTKERFSVLSKN